MNRLKELREEAMMTVRELSERSGVSEDTITKIENGHRKGRGMTLRKLARVLGVTPHQVSPEQFERGTESESLSHDSILRLETGSTGPTGAGDQGNPQVSRVLQARNVVETVADQSGLLARAHFKHLTEEQRNLLLAVNENSGVTPPEVARQVGCSISAANSGLAVLGEYGLVSRNESDESQVTPLGEGVAGILAKGGLHSDDALRYVSTLIKAYESALVHGDRPQRLDEFEAQLFYDLQESVVRTIKGIVNAAEPTPDAERALYKRPSPTVQSNRAPAQEEQGRGY